MRSRRFRARHKRPSELNIIAFLNIMVILIPFLLVTAVFSRTNILELNIPPASFAAPADELKKDMQLVVTIRKNAIDVGDTVGGLLKRIPATSKGHDFRALSDLLVQIKTRFPDKKNAAILAEPEISYEILVQTMDAVRSVEQAQVGSVVRAELFPDISIGDAVAE
jgi:biopolymer transport protein ExbD